jgi:hypothetical protein
VVFNDNIGQNQDSVSREIDLPEVLRFAQDDSWHIERLLESASEPELQPSCGHCAPSLGSPPKTQRAASLPTLPLFPLCASVSSVVIFIFFRCAMRSKIQMARAG